uniref:Phosphoribosylglycinamide synthetase-like protein n=2 Tax=Sulfobacillus thermotolerans TaxID=338644 RepID=G5CJ34_9FIRM|nr:phosphoribosylglycinamide synthetase-like protein [Sulfobacillus thermotolerans]
MNETTHVLVVGGMKVMRHKLKRLGVRISWLTDMTRVGNANSDLEDRVLAMPLNDLDMVLSTVKALHEIDPFDHLAAFLDRDQMLASYIAADLGIGYHAPAVVEQFNNKLLMRHRLRVHGLDTTRSAPVTSVEDLLRVGHDFGFPLILKPLDDWGSRNVSRISSPENCETASAKLSGTMLAEEFLSGKELSVEMFSENGHHFPICVTEKFNERVHFVEIGHRLPYVKDTEKNLRVCFAGAYRSKTIKWAKPYRSDGEGRKDISH